MRSGGESSPYKDERRPPFSLFGIDENAKQFEIVASAIRAPVLSKTNSEVPDFTFQGSLFIAKWLVIVQFTLC